MRSKICFYDSLQKVLSEKRCRQKLPIAFSVEHLKVEICSYIQTYKGRFVEELYHPS